MAVSDFLHRKLFDLSGTTLEVDGKEINVFETFRNTPRTGKSCRIDSYGLGLPKRSLFDHLTSMATQADVFAKYASIDISEQLFADMIAYHDWHELLIGDVPEFTPPELAGNLYMNDEEKRERKAQADELIVNSLSGEFKDAYVAIDAEVHKNHPFFNMVDKTDPIIAIWRYIHLFKENLDIEKFLDAMTHFFTNPKVVPTCTDEKIAQLIAFLQNKANARLYFERGFSVFEGQAIELDDIKLMLMPDMHFIPQ